jgi:hypothetical protein
MSTAIGTLAIYLPGGQQERMKTQACFDTASGVILSRTALCVLMFCSGCLQHRVSIGDGYRIVDNGGAPLLVPNALQNNKPGKFQTVMVNLPAGQSDTKIRAGGDCAIHGAIFSLQPGSSSNNRSWVVRSPSTSGWNAVSGEADVDEQWKLFIGDLAHMHDLGCFPSGLSTQSIRSAVAERIPLPANLVPIFMYSDRGERFVNLAPGMDIRIQKVLPNETPADTGPKTSLRILTIDYDVVSRHDGGTELRLSHRPDGVRGAPLGRGDRQFLTLDQRFAPTSVMRLFLQGLSEEKQGKQEFDPILIGASDTAELDALTDLFRQRDSATCVDRRGTACIELPHGSISLFSTVWVNGQKTTCSFGSPLVFLLLPLPPQKQAKALESIRVMRRLDLGHYVDIQITRTPDGARQLLLLPGDRIDWKN